METPVTRLQCCSQHIGNWRYFDERILFDTVPTLLIIGKANSLIFCTHYLEYIIATPIQWYVLPITRGGWWGIGGELTCPNGTSLRLDHLPSPYTSLTNTPYLPVIHSVCMWQGDMGVWIGTIPTLCSNPLGKILMANPPPFSNICTRKVGNTFMPSNVWWCCQIAASGTIFLARTEIQSLACQNLIWFHDLFLTFYIDLLVLFCISSAIAKPNCIFYTFGAF